MNRIFDFNNLADPFQNCRDFYPTTSENPTYTPTRHNQQSPAQQQRAAKKRRNKQKFNR